MISSYAERRYSWERRIEDIIIEMSKETDANGLVIQVGHEGLTGEFLNMIDDIEIAKKQSKENPGMARMIPGDKHNEE